MDYNQFNDPDLDEIIDYINNQEDDEQSVIEHNNIKSDNVPKPKSSKPKPKKLNNIMNYKNHFILVVVYFIMSQNFVISTYKKINPITKKNPQISQLDMIIYGVLLTAIYNMILFYFLSNLFL